MGWGILGSSQALNPPRYLPSVTPDFLNLPWQTIQLTTRDGVSIAGWFIPKPKPQGTLILLHGYGTSKADLLDIAHGFHTQGPYHLILIDLRGHGLSGGGVSFGRREIWDIEAALRFAGEEPGLKGLPVGCYGISMGGAVALLAAPRFPQIKAVVTDSAYADLAAAVARTQWLTYHIPRFPLGEVALWALGLRLGCRLKALSPSEAVGRIAPRPLLLIHGESDQSIPMEEGKRLHRQANPPKELWLVPQAEHVGSFYLERERYVARILEFFRKALA